jgi:hypothetical protein
VAEPAAIRYRAFITSGNPWARFKELRQGLAAP